MVQFYDVNEHSLRVPNVFKGMKKAVSHMEFLYFFAKRFIAGTHSEDAIARAKLLQRYHIKTTLDILGEDVKNITEARYAVQEYQQLIEEIRKNEINATISIKLTHLGLMIDKQKCLVNIEKVLSFAQKHKVNIEIDMEGSKYTNDIITIYKKVLENYPCTMIALQAYLKRSMSDAEQLVKKDARIRLVKGAYKESSALAFPKKSDVDKNYEALMQFCLKNSPHVHIATHDEKLIMKAVKFIELNNISEGKYEFAFLLGVKEKLQKRLAKDNFPVRVYVPFGEHWLPYTLRRLRERRANLWFAVKSIFSA